MIYRILALCLLVGIVGCGSGDPLNRQPVSGNISLKGKPIVFGTIEFTPNEGQSTPLTVQITDGKFTIDKSGGLSPGTYTIRIQGYDSPPPVQDVPGEPAKGAAPKQLVPPKYNTQSKETVTIKTGQNEVVLDLQP